MTTYSNLLVSEHGPVFVITINRPLVMNALDKQTLHELGEALFLLEANQSLRALIITGAGEKSFVAGADISEMQGLSSQEAEELSKLGHSVCDRIDAFRVPVIAAVNGFALGGGLELALACDFIYASANAKFGLVETKLGLVPGFGGVARLSRRVSIARAKEMILSASIIDSDEATRIGLVNRKVTEGSVLDAALALSNQIAKLGPMAIASAKQLLNDGASLPLDEANLLEQSAFGKIFSTNDHAEGIRAFLEKRPAHFEGS